MRPKDWLKIIMWFAVTALLPRVMLFYFACGLIDFKRSNTFDVANWKRYFLGNGVFTWFLSPLNLFLDLFCEPNKGVYQLHDLPAVCQDEIQQVAHLAENNPELITTLRQHMAEKKRGMIFFKWYGKNIDASVNIPEFHQPFRYVKTIGVSILNKNETTSIHYGPLRVSFRVLYNLVPTHNANIYIKAGGHKHLWHNNPLFIFDDTLVHQSVNRSDELRYCLFIDILRPSKYLRFQEFMVKLVRSSMVSANRVFYKKWDMIK